MTVARSASQILKKIGCDKLTLHKGEGYWYFEYDDFEMRKVYETRTIYIMYLSHWSLENWVEQGLDFIEEMKETK